MPLFINSTEVEKLYVNGQEKKLLKINDIPVFGKRYYLTGKTKGAKVTINRIVSPNQGLKPGEISGYAPIYFGDEIYFSVTAQSGYNYPRFYTKIGKGYPQPRLLSVTENVIDDIEYEAQADYYITKSDTRWFEELNGNGTPCITYRAIFEHIVLDWGIEQERKYIEICGNNVKVPCEIRDCGAQISVSCVGNKLDFKFYKVTEAGKGLCIQCNPKELILTEVKKV